MAFRLYLVPVVGAGTRADARRPKYFASGEDGTGTTGAVTGAWSAMDYGFEPWMVVGADLSTADDTLVVGKADVTALPVDLAPTLTGPQVTATKNKLDAMNVPDQWVTTSLTWSQVVRTVLGVFSFLQRYGAIYADQNGTPAPTLFGGGVTLNTTFASLPLAVRSALSATAVDQNISTAGVTGSTTVRVLLKLMADAYQSRQYNFNGTLI
jgi:hypothetical protein